MKKIELPEQKKLLIDLLKYIADVCKEENIKYSLIGGSLIGAIRHKGIIPWDDDVDMILMPEEYDKLIKALENKDHYYKVYNPETNKDYLYPFAKLVDTRTILKENNTKQGCDMGVYVDIFKYHYVSNNNFIRKLHYKRLFFIQTMFARAMLYPKNIKNLKSKMIVIFANIFGPRYFKRRHMHICNKVKPTNYILSNWPAYGYEGETHHVSSYKEYKIVPFENIKVSITTDYDNVLTKAYGNYMALPPKEKRVTKHDTEIYWK